MCGSRFAASKNIPIEVHFDCFGRKKIVIFIDLEGLQWEKKYNRELVEVEKLWKVRYEKVGKMRKKMGFK